MQIYAQIKSCRFITRI